jgi:NAD(P)-dependent dehydrogenase (short-subunit alcohol dehydrogenase family)
MKIVITGGASGLGEAITRRLAQNATHEVWFTYSSSTAMARELEQTFPNAHGIQCDFKIPADLDALLEKVDEIGPDALVNNAISAPIVKKHFHRMGLDVFKNGFAQNVLPAVEITQRAISIFREKKGGRIVTILTATLVGRPPGGYAEYTAAKAYLHSLAKSWAAENAAYGIASNCISPGFMATRLTSDTDERIIEEMINRHPLKRLLSTAEVAEAVEFFVNAPLHVNGTNLIISAASEML